ncbi:Galactose-1-phosphate uridylyltransferase [archaeon HR06]|nr:Galactose-1-phosphate uridylyltransferase [archaeon HR06]
MEPPFIYDKAPLLSKPCKLCEVVKRESGGEREIINTDEFIVLCPWASRVPYEILLLPKRHEKDFFSLKDEALKELSEILCKIFKALNKILGNFPFNFWFSNYYRGIKDYHWHLEILPRLTYFAGLELGSGVYINILYPEEACKNIKACL